VIQGEQALEDIGIGESGRPAVGGKDGFVEHAMRIGQPRGPLVVEVGKRAILALQFTGAWRIQPGIALGDELFGSDGLQTWAVSGPFRDTNVSNLNWCLTGNTFDFAREIHREYRGIMLYGRLLDERDHDA